MECKHLSHIPRQYLDTHKLKEKRFILGHNFSLYWGPQEWADGRCGRQELLTSCHPGGREEKNKGEEGDKRPQVMPSSNQRPDHPRGSAAFQQLL